MAIVEITDGRELYFILTHMKKIIIYFYVGYRSECLKFNKKFIDTSRKTEYNRIVFCQVDVNLMANIGYIYNVEINKTPLVIFINDGKICKKFYGNNPELLDDYITDFSYL